MGHNTANTKDEIIRDKDKHIGVTIITEDGCTTPFRATIGSAGYDIHAKGDYFINPKSQAFISTGIYLAMSLGFECQIRSRSGLAAKHGVFVLNAPATIDSDYTGELKVILYNLGTEQFVIPNGSRIAQLVFASTLPSNLIRGGTLGTTVRGDGGFGSTGTQTNTQDTGA